MFELGVDMSAVAIPRLVGTTRVERVVEIVKIMNETGFAARVTSPGKGEKLPRIECKNCVFHDLSKDYTEVCQFDLGFLSGLMGAPIEHQECMQRGGRPAGSGSCRRPEFQLMVPAFQMASRPTPR
jgi:predicted ArsR family transcriptional regulator